MSLILLQNVEGKDLMCSISYQRTCEPGLVVLACNLKFWRLKLDCELEASMDYSLPQNNNNKKDL
jgi:hypothetical protein